jgi:hypothetical protein
MILPLVLRNMFYRVAVINHLFISDPTQVCDVTRIPCNAVPPDHCCQEVNPTLKPVFRSAETGEAESGFKVGAYLVANATKIFSLILKYVF